MKAIRVSDRWIAARDKPDGFLQKNEILFQYQNSEETNKHGERKKESSRRRCWMLAACKRRQKKDFSVERFSLQDFS
jgi:hypothetical protein